MSDNVQNSDQKITLFKLHLPKSKCYANANNTCSILLKVIKYTWNTVIHVTGLTHFITQCGSSGI